jgi:predicted dehydrogenase
VSHNYDGIHEIVDKSNRTGARIMVGFDLHYDCGLQKVKELIASNAIGNIVSANAQVGQYLPDWRPHEDYRLGMSAKQETGGGVMLDLVHEFDYLYWLLGDVETIASFNHNSGSLQIETEDVAEVLLKFSNGAIGTIHLDYLQPKLVRNCLLTGSNGTILWNLADSKVGWVDHQKQQQEFSYAGFERNDRFIHIIKDFLEKKDNAFTTSLQQGLQSLQMVLAAKYSAANNVFVNLNQFNH